MPSPSTRVRVDKQGRLVLPQELRAGLVDLPGEVLLSRTPDGLLLSPVTALGSVRLAADGLPVLQLERPVTNTEVISAVDEARRDR